MSSALSSLSPSSTDKLPLQRRLGLTERLFYGAASDQSVIVQRCLILETPLDLYAHTREMTESISEWKRLNPMLTVCIRQSESEEFPRNLHFAFSDKITQASLDDANVKYLYLKKQTEKKSESDDNKNKSQCRENDEEIWKLLMEKGTDEAFDANTGPLWSLTFFQVENDADTSKDEQKVNNKYACIWKYHHSIADGRGSYAALLQLFSLIENSIALSSKNSSTTTQPQIDKTKKNTSVMLPPCKEDILNLPFPPKLVAEETQGGTVSAPMKKPTFLATSLKKEEQEYKHKQQQREKSEAVIYEKSKTSSVETTDDVVFSTVDNLITFSHENHSKFRFISINEDHLKHILLVCRQHKTKLSSFIDLVAHLAVRMIYEKHDEKESKHQALLTGCSTNMTHHDAFKAHFESSEESLDTNLICNYSGALKSSPVPTQLAYREGDETWIEEFWKTSGEMTTDLHEKSKYPDQDILPAIEFVREQQLQQEKKNPNPNPKPSTESKPGDIMHYNISNLGVLKTANANSNSIRVKEAYSCNRLEKDKLAFMFLFSVASVESKLFLSLFHNSNKVAPCLVNELIENLTKLIAKVVDQSSFSFTEASSSIAS